MHNSLTGTKFLERVLNLSSESFFQCQSEFYLAGVMVEMLDLSQTQKMEGATRWHAEINQLYHPTGELGQDSCALVYSCDVLNITKFVPILIKEWFYLVKPGGYLVIDYKPNKICDWRKLEKMLWWLWKGNYEILFHEAIGNLGLKGASEEKLCSFIRLKKEYYKKSVDAHTPASPASNGKNPARAGHLPGIYC